MAITNPYLKDGKPILLPSYCLYMDILGFQERMREAFKEGQGELLLEKLYLSLSENLRLFDGIDTDRYPFQYKVFTDNIVVGCPIRSGSGLENEFGSVITYLGLYQLSMALEGFFVRGGFTTGLLHISEEIVYGETLLDAYEIEKNIASVPRVIISEDIIKMIEKYLEWHGRDKISSENKEILLDADKGYFVNYLGWTVGHTYIRWEMIKKHKRNVEDCLGRFKSDTVVYNKFLWVANYHNYFCKLIKRFCGSKSGYKNDYLIDVDEAIKQPRMLIEDYLDFWL